MFIQNLLISQPRHFCQGIDKVMLIRSVLFNFQGAFLNSVFPISQTTLLLYHIFSNLSRGFLNFFSKFFSNHLGSFKRSDFLFESFYIISHCLSFVKRFSKLFSKFFVTFSLSLCPHLECLSIISPSSTKVNTFLKSFFSFVTYALYI